MEKLEMKYKYYPNRISMPWIRNVYDDGKLNKYASGRIEKAHISQLSDDEVEMLNNAPKSEYCGAEMRDKHGNYYWVYIENHTLYRGSGKPGDIGGFNPGFTKGRN